MYAIKSDSPFIYLVALWPLFFVGIWAVWNMLRDSRQERAALRAANWPEIQGKVTNSKAVWGHFEVTYQYNIGARFYCGTYIINLPPVVPDQFARGASKVAAEVKQDLRDFPPGLDVIIKYNPQKLAQSILLCRGQITGAGSQEKEIPEFFSLS